MDFEEKLLNAQENDKVIYYDYLMYKRGAGWWTGLINSDWIRPVKIKKARYKASFLQNLPNYYFLGFPIKELLKHTNSYRHCHACVIALSLYFNEFEIVTCNLQSYVEFYNSHAQYDSDKMKELEHTFLLVDIDNKKTVIDTSWGLITDLDTYNYIFNPNQIRTISHKEIKDTEIYKFIEERKTIEGPSVESEHKNDKEYEEYINMLNEYTNMCKSYKNPNNKQLEDYINRCLYQTSHIYCFGDWRYHLSSKICNNKFIYPTNNMYSLVDDEFDETLYAVTDDSIKRNKRILEEYHKPKLIKTLEKVKDRFSRLADDIYFLFK